MPKRNSGRYRHVDVNMWLVRIAILLLIVAAIGVALVPLLVMVDLLQGGTGWGLCPSGIEACDVPYTTPFEFLLVLVVAMFLIVLAIRLVMRLARRLQAESYQVNERV
jgi:hypothetical protein